MPYNWQHTDWPNFKYDLADAQELLLEIAQKLGTASGMFHAYPDVLQEKELIDIMVAEAIKTSQIEGEHISREDVVSSIKKNLGIKVPVKSIADKRATGVAALITMVREDFNAPLSEGVLFEWHRSLMGYAKNIHAGKWRKHKSPMIIVSGAVGREKVHFEAPPSSMVPDEMKRFIAWFNDTAPGGKIEIKNAPIRSAIAHLYFESIHPFEDGNGRIGRAIAEKALAQTTGRPLLFSLSQAIEADKKNYYRQLQVASQTLFITDWILFFLEKISEALNDVAVRLSFTLLKTKYIDCYKANFNARQEKAILKMLESPAGFKGGMTARKYISINKTSKATATRDLQALVEMNALVAKGSGRSVCYELNLDRK